MTCQVCGHDKFVHNDVLWPQLTYDWQLTPSEVKYVNVQQGTRCEACGVNVRSQALAKAIMDVTGGWRPLKNWVHHARLKMLEINEAGNLTPWLSQVRTCELARYPQVDMLKLPYLSANFDLVVHSDTLEHISHCVLALAECHRVLVDGGALVFTVPIIVNRMTRNRRGLPPSYHGHVACEAPDFLVHTEFGADVWTYVIRAGFRNCQFVVFHYPAGIAIVAQKGGPE